jgi:hypothetical protein
MSTDVSTTARTDLSLGAVGAAIGPAGALGMQLGMIAWSMNAALADAWLRGTHAMLCAMSAAAGSEPSAAAGDDAWAAWRHACALAAEPWQAWLPLLRIDMP